MTPGPDRPLVSPSARAVHAAACVALLAGATALLVTYDRPCLFAVCLLATGFGGAAGVVAWRGSRWRDAWLLVSSLWFALAIGELGALWYRSRPDPEATRFDPDPYAPRLKYYRSDSALGYSLNPDRAVRSGLHDKDGVIYDVTYHVDSHGIRRTPASATSGPAVAFFGCSYTYGEGLQDDETLPNQFARTTGGQYRVLNLALHGYGPHQMLRAIEVGRYDSLFGREPAAFVYLAASWQAPRSAGRSSWDRAGPRYVLSGDSVRYDGSFDSATGIVARALDWSALYGLLRERLWPVRSADIELFVRIIRTAHRVLKERYGVGLSVMYVRAPEFERKLREVGWSDDSISVALRAAGVLLVDGQTPTAPENSPSLYELRNDGHPTVAANAARAESLMRHLTLPPAVGRSPD